MQNSLLDLELQEVKSTIIESRSHISGQALLDAQRSEANGDSFSREDEVGEEEQHLEENLLENHDLVRAINKSLQQDRIPSD